MTTNYIRDNKLSHWHINHITLSPKVYPQEITMKPHGFWFDVDEDWKRWCIAETFRLDYLKVQHEVAIKNYNTILILNTSYDLDRFTEKYHIDRDRYSMVRHYYIDWPTICKQYTGIIITPYCWKRRMELMWYYSWDCASGCVWDINNIEIIGSVVHDTSKFEREEYDYDNDKDNNDEKEEAAS
jgi:hypothetical protein